MRAAPRITGGGKQLHSCSKDWEPVRGRALQAPRSVQKHRGEEVAQVPKLGFPWSPQWRPWWSSSVPAAPTTCRGLALVSRGIYLNDAALGSTGNLPSHHGKLKHNPGRTCGPMEKEVLAGAVLLARLVAPQKILTGAVVKAYTS